MDVILSIKEYGGAGSLAMNLSLSNGLYLSPNAFEGFPVANSIMWLRSNIAGCGMLDVECWILDVKFDFSFQKDSISVRVIPVIFMDMSLNITIWWPSAYILASAIT